MVVYYREGGGWENFDHPRSEKKVHRSPTPALETHGKVQLPSRDARKVQAPPLEHTRWIQKDCWAHIVKWLPLSKKRLLGEGGPGKILQFGCKKVWFGQEKLQPPLLRCGEKLQPPPSFKWKKTSTPPPPQFPNPPPPGNKRPLPNYRLRNIMIKWDCI